MKKLLLILLFCPLLSFAQNWHGVPVGQHNIYRVSVSGADSIWDGYLRNIHIVDSVSASSHTQYNFYKTLRKDTSEILDTAQGPTWLGRYFIRYNTGDELFLNKYLDTILIKTSAALNQSWTMARDTSGNISFTATVSSLDTATIDGSLDSIKRIDIQAYSGSTVTASIYNNYQIVLSKHHGFYNTLDFYAFPNYIMASRISGFSTNLMGQDIYPNLPYQHERLDSTVITRAWNYNDLAWQYQPGNQWIYNYSANPWLKYVLYDSIISATFIGSDTAIVTAKRDSLYDKRITPTGAAPYWLRIYSSTIEVDTIISQPSLPYQLDSMENLAWSPIGIAYDYYNWLFLGYYCQDKIAIHDSSAARTPLSGFKTSYGTKYEGLNIYDRHSVNSNGAQSLIFFRNIDYMNVNGCKIGTFYSITPDALSNIYKSDDIFKLYPNPTTNSFYLETNEDWNSLEIISIQGQTVLSFDRNHGSQFSLATLPSGLYIVKIKTDTGNFLQKILKE